MSDHYALISVSDKTNLAEFVQELIALNYSIIATGGTAKALREDNLEVIEVSAVTGFPEIMQGRVKTLHPKILGGILGKRDLHADEMAEHQIPSIDLVICNLYPFVETIKQPSTNLDQALENIDIGGPTMLRAAAKNFQWVTVLVDVKDYLMVLEELKVHGKISFENRKKLAAKAFSHVAQYDACIANYLNPEPFPKQLTLTFQKTGNLRYGENPHQPASVYRTLDDRPSLLSSKQLQGKELSFNNILDIESAINCLREFTKPTCVIVKHTNPCGVASHEDLHCALLNAWVADAKSAFGGIIALNQECTAKMAEYLVQQFIEVVLAPSFTLSALEIFKQKSAVRVLAIGDIQKLTSKYEAKWINGGIILQAVDNFEITDKTWQTVTTSKLDYQQIEDLLFAWKVVKHVKSNAIVIAQNQMTLGIGAGQVSRIDSVKLALNKAEVFLSDLDSRLRGNGSACHPRRKRGSSVYGCSIRVRALDSRFRGNDKEKGENDEEKGGNNKGVVLASDAFFPFRDSIDLIATKQIKTIIQPGGSIRDQEIIKACNEHQISMIFTGTRCFKH